MTLQMASVGEPLSFGFALRGQSVRGFSGLADADRQRFCIEDGIAIAEFAAVIDFDLQAGKPFDHELSGEAGVPAGAAGDDAHLLEFAELLFGDVHFVEEDFSGVLRDAAEESVADGARLLENLLLHEMLVAALFGHDGVPGDVMRGAIDGAAIVIHHAHAILREDGDIAVGEEEHLAGVFEERGNIAGDKIFAVAKADHGRRTNARGDDFVRVAGGEKNQGIDAAQLLEGFADGLFERHAALRILLDEMGDDFGVRFGDEFVAFALKLFFQFEIIFDDAVVDDDDLAGAVAMRDAHFLRWGGRAWPSACGRCRRCLREAISESTSSRLRSFPGARRISSLPC